MIKTAEYTHKAFDGIDIVKGWLLEDNYGNKHWVYFNGVELCVHPMSDWEGELVAINNE